MSREQEPIWPVDEEREQIILQIRILDYLISQAGETLRGLSATIQSLELSLQDTPTFLAVKSQDFEKPLALKQPLQQVIERMKEDISKINKVIESYRQQRSALQAKLDKPPIVN